MSSQAGISACRSVSLGVGRDHPQLLLTGEGALALHIPPLVELTGIPIRPLLGDVMGGMGGPGREVHKERLVRHQRLLLTDPADRVVGQVLGQVVPLLGCRRRLDRRRALVQRRVPLVVLPTDEPIEVLEPATSRRPGVERTHRRCLPHRHLVALAELRRRIPIQLQRHRQRRLGVRTQRIVPRSRRRRLGDRAHPHRMMVTPRQQRRPGRRAQRGGVEAVVAQPTLRQPVGGRRTARPPKRGRGAEAHIVDEHDQHVRCPLRRQQRLDRRVRGLGILGVIGRQPGRRTIRDRQHRAGMPVRAHRVPP